MTESKYSDVIWLSAEGRWCRYCPDCHDVLSYKNRGDCTTAEKNGDRHRSCGVGSIMQYIASGLMWSVDGCWLRRCPKCNDKVIHTGKYAASDAQKAIRRGWLCCDCGAKKGGRARRGISGPQFNSWAGMVDEERVIRVERCRQNALGERNSMYGRPSPRGSGVGWKGWYNGVYFRSLRELSFMVNNPTATSAEGNEWRARYIWGGSNRTTMPDFILVESRIVVECKPKRLWHTPLVAAKAEAVSKLAVERGFKYELVDPPMLEKQVIIRMIEDGIIVMNEKYEAKVREYASR